jgi:probable rRNA maturation factor
MLNFSWNIGHSPSLRREVERKLLDAAHALGMRDEDEATITVCADRRITTLNARFRKQNETTDVLSFPCDTPVLAPGKHASIAKKQPPRLMGDIFVNLRQVERQARRNGNSVADETAAVAVHGLLHLLGFGHEGKADTDKMLAEEKRLFKHASIKVVEFGH